MLRPSSIAVIAYFVLVALGVLVHIVDHMVSNRSRMSRLKSILSFGRKHPLAVLSVALGALAMASLGQNAHQLWLVHLGFGVTYLILLVPLIWGISRLIKWKPEQIDDEKAPSVAVIILCCLFIVIVIPFHHDKIISLRPERSVPLFTLKVSNSAFPVSVPPHSTLLILPLHPYQTFTVGASHLHEYDNPCADAHNWPSKSELDSKAANTFEEVRHVEITNHSHTTIESGHAVFGVRYKQSLSGDCPVPPSHSAPTQNDVIFIPALDEGKTFDFVTVNQTAQCAWIVPPENITVKMVDVDNEQEVPLKIEPTLIANWLFTPFGPTSIKWEGVPIKNPGYGMVRSGAPCQLPNDEGKRHLIQHKLAQLMNEGIILRTRWEQVMGMPESNQRVVSGEIPYWHAKVENYIRTLPRSDVYMTKLNSASKSDFGYPVGINQNIAGNWDQLTSDLRSLKELMDDPDFGRP